METMINNRTGSRKQVKRGFSWTMLFFGVLVPLFRGDLLWFAISLVLAIVTSGVSWLILPFFYNSIYMNRLFDKGYVLV